MQRGGGAAGPAPWTPPCRALRPCLLPDSTKALLSVHFDKEPGCVLGHLANTALSHQLTDCDMNLGFLYDVVMWFSGAAQGRLKRALSCS